MPESYMPAHQYTPRIKLIMRGLVAITLLGWLLSGQRCFQVWELITHLEPMPFATACILYGLGQVLSSWRWQWLARRVRIQARLSYLVRLYFIGMFFNLFLPTSMGGDLVRSWILARQTRNNKLAPALLSVVSERLNGLVALLALGCVASLAVVGQLPTWQIGLMWGLAMGGITMLVTLPVVGQRFAVGARLAQALSITSKHRRVWWRAFFVSLAVQLAAVVQVWLVARALHLLIPLTVLAVVVPIVTVSSLLPVTIAGLGLREGTLLLLLTPLGVSAAEAVSLGLAWLAMQGVTSLLGLPLWLGLSEARVQTRYSFASSDEQLRAHGARSASESGIHLDTPTGGETRHGRLGGDPDQGREGQSAVAT